MKLAFTDATLHQISSLRLSCELNNYWRLPFRHRVHSSDMRRAGSFFANCSASTLADA